MVWLHDLCRLIVIYSMCYTINGGIVADASTNFSHISLEFSPKKFFLEKNLTQNVTISFSQNLPENTELIFNYANGDSIAYVQDHEVIQPLANITIQAGESKCIVEVTATNIGSLTVGLNSTAVQFDNLDRTFFQVSVIHKKALIIIEQVIGWIYFLAWSISFYPQVYQNWKRKSVVGLSFDFVSLNITGFIVYFIFNMALYWIPSVQAEYFKLHPRGVNPVQLNDVSFALHAAILTLVTLIQCAIYERGSQKVSKIGIFLIALVWTTALILLFITIGHVLTWLTFIYCFSYIKLFITLVKYFPQAYTNFRRKSTDGWSIGNVILDFVGGSFSLLQMFMIAYNSDDWGSIFGDPTKFGLGAFSIAFDILFIIQHYVLYRSKPQQYEELIGDVI